MDGGIAAVGNREPLDDPVRHLLRLAVGRLEDDERELVAADPVGPVRSAQARLDDPRDAQQGAVARRMPVLVVKGLERVHVAEGEREAPAVARRARRLRLQVAHERPAVAEAGQRVVVGEVAQLAQARGGLEHGRGLVGEDPERLQGLDAREQPVARVLDPDQAQQLARRGAQRYEEAVVLPRPRAAARPLRRAAEIDPGGDRGALRGEQEAAVALERGSSRRATGASAPSSSSSIVTRSKPRAARIPSVTASSSSCAGADSRLRAKTSRKCVERGAMPAQVGGLRAWRSTHGGVAGDRDQGVELASPGPGRSRLVDREHAERRRRPRARSGTKRASSGCHASGSVLGVEVRDVGERAAGVPVERVVIGTKIGAPALGAGRQQRLPAAPIRS